MRAYLPPIMGRQVTSDRTSGGAGDGFESCVGCGGRNPPDAPECEWCARPFRSSSGRGRRWWPLGLGIVGPEVLEDDSAWVEVQTDAGQRGWVQSDLVRPLVGGPAAG